MATYIDKIGVELELAVKRTESGERPSVTHFRHVSDGSISVNDREARNSGFTAREYVSKPTDYKSDWENPDMRDLETGLYELYKKHDAYGNSSMGTHIHVSFNKPGYYAALASKRFIEHFMERITESDLYDRNDRLRERYSGVHYAQPVSNERDIERTIRGSRDYRHFTYRTGMKTVEFRIMPAFDRKRDVMDAIELITTTVNSYLFNKKYEFEEEAESTDDTEKLPENPENPSEVFNSV